MNRKFLFTLIITMSTILVSAIAGFLLDPSRFLLHFVNTMFYISIPLVVLGGFLFIWERGGFNITRYAFRKTRFLFNPKEESLLANTEERKDDKELLYKTYSFPITYPILLTGIITALLSSIISFTVLI